MYTFQRFLYISAAICIIRIHIAALKVPLIRGAEVSRTGDLIPGECHKAFIPLILILEGVANIGYWILGSPKKQIQPWNMRIYNT